MNNIHSSDVSADASTGCASGILLAAGSGNRMEGAVADKILAPLNGLPAFAHSVRAFIDSRIVDRLTVVYRDEAQKAQLQNALILIDLNGKPIDWVTGGSERQDSVYNALQSQPADCAYVYIHDCARPLISIDALQALQTAVQRDRAAVLAHPVSDTIKRVPATGELVQTSLDDLDRKRLWAMETPQAFAYPEILTAYAHVHKQGLHITDDTAAAATIGLKITIVPNASPNPKLTTPADLDYAECLLKR